DPVTARSGADGAFRIARLPYGTYTVDAVAARWRSKPLSISLAVGGAADQVVLEVQAATPFDGRALVGDKPCTLGRVDLDGPSPATLTFSPDGRVHLDGLWPGDYRVSVICFDADRREEALAVSDAPVIREWDLLSDEESHSENGKPMGSLQADVAAR